MKAKRLFAAGALAAVLLSSTAALASVRFVGGGIWTYGTTGTDGGGTVYSRYDTKLHEYHSASVCNARGCYIYDVRSKWGGKAVAQAQAFPYETDHAYYNFWD